MEGWMVWYAQDRMRFADELPKEEKKMKEWGTIRNLNAFLPYLLRTNSMALAQLLPMRVEVPRKRYIPYFEKKYSFLRY
jgi:hypothetical protein